MAYKSKEGVPYSASIVVRRPKSDVLEVLLNASRSVGARPASTGSGFQIRRRYMPAWAKGIGIPLVIGTFGIGILVFLLVRKTDVLNANLTEMSDGTLVAITGMASPALCDALQQACAQLQQSSV